MFVIAFRYLSRFAFVLIEGHWGKQFEFIPLPGMLEVILGVSSLNCGNMSYPHLGSLQRKEQINFEKLFQKGYMTIPFPTSFLTCLWIHIKHTWGLVQKPSVGAWLSICLVIPCFFLPLDVFSFILWTELGLPQLLVIGLTHYICDQPIDPMEIHLLHRVHGGERTTSHDVVRDAFVSIAKDARFQVL